MYTVEIVQIVYNNFCVYKSKYLKSMQKIEDITSDFRFKLLKRLKYLNSF